MESELKRVYTQNGMMILTTDGDEHWIDVERMKVEGKPAMSYITAFASLMRGLDYAILAYVEDADTKRAIPLMKKRYTVEDVTLPGMDIMMLKVSNKEA